MDDRIIEKREELQQEALRLVQDREQLLRQLDKMNNRLAEIAGSIKTLDELFSNKD